jgi:HEAT repeat protein
MKSVETILEYLRHEKPQKRCMGLLLVARQRVQSVYPVILELLGDEDSEVRATAAWTLDELGIAEAIPDLIDALYDPVFSVRSNAGWALVHLAERHIPELVLPEVIDVLKDTNNYDAREMAYLVLQAIGGDAAWQAIRDHWLP